MYSVLRLLYCKRIGRYPLLSVDPLWRALFFFFFPPLFFLLLSLSARWFNTYQIPILFLSLLFFFSLFGSFFFLFFPPLTFPLPSFFFSFSYSFPIPFLLLVSFFLPLSAAILSLFPPFLHFSHRVALMPAPPPHYSFKKSWGEH